jgi:hypothetical protein
MVDALMKKNKLSGAGWRSCSVNSSWGNKPYGYADPQGSDQLFDRRGHLLYLALFERRYSLRSLAQKRMWELKIGPETPEEA